MTRFHKFSLVILAFSVCLGAAFAEITIDGKNVYVETDAYSVQFRHGVIIYICLLYTSPSPRDRTRSRMPSSA